MVDAVDLWKDGCLVFIGHALSTVRVKLNPNASGSKTDFNIYQDSDMMSEHLKSAFRQANIAMDTVDNRTPHITMIALLRPKTKFTPVNVLSDDEKDTYCQD